MTDVNGAIPPKMLALAREHVAAEKGRREEAARRKQVEAKEAARRKKAAAVWKLALQQAWAEDAQRERERDAEREAEDERNAAAEKEVAGVRAAPGEISDSLRSSDGDWSH